METMSWKSLLIFLAIVAIVATEELSIKNDIKRKSFTNNTRLKRIKSRVMYYSNTTATFKIMLSGDIERNPGPGFCPKCEKSVNKNLKRLECTVCHVCHFAHTKFIKQFNVKAINARIPRFYTCSKCLFTELPFAKTHLL